MNRTPRIRIVIGILMWPALCLSVTSCGRMPGRPKPGPEVPRPEQVIAFSTLYKDNCAGCHGENGKNGAAIALANPVYLAVIGESHLRDTIANGVIGGLMPGFAKSAGGMLTDRQVAVLAHGIIQEWGNPNALAGQNPPPWQATLPADPGHGQEAYTSFCARCHGTTGEGGPADGNPASRGPRLGSIVDPAYLALISNQNLRSITIAGRPDQGMPDWRTDGTQPMTDQQLTDIIAWLASKRISDPGQPYPRHP